jgi:muramoyltetrapeptide carboxypeptidase
VYTLGGQARSSGGHRSRHLLKPPALCDGDTIGLIAPSFPLLPAWRAAYERGTDMLRALGFTSKEGQTIGLCRYWAAGTPQDQADDINRMFADPEVKAIITLTGGFPGMSVLDRIDYATIRAHPKPFLGFSDITLYHLAFFARCGLVGFHADGHIDGLGGTWPQLDGSRRGYLMRLYRQLLTSTTPVGLIEPARAWECWRPGQARGPLVGGCLKRITALAATPYFPALEVFDGAILFWEEIGREIWDLSIDLYILKHRGILDRIAGMLIGQLTWINQNFEGIDYPTVREVVFDVVDGYSFPIMASVDFGHQIANIPLPIGIEAIFDAEAASLALVEAPVL